jgi:hypothetical protein
MHRLGRVIGLLMLSLGLGVDSAAESHGEDIPAASLDRAKLIAIKEALVSEAQSTESRVINASWLDAEGQLHESTMVHSAMQVRGIQVQVYLDEMQKPKVEIALDDKKGLLPKCFAKDGHLKRTVRVLPVRMQGHFAAELQPIASESVRIFASEFNNYFKDSAHWHAKSPVQQADAYQSIVSGLRADLARYEMTVTVAKGLLPEGHRPERIPGSDPVSTFFMGEPSAFAENWVHLKAQITKVASGELIWSGTSDVRVPVRSVAYTNDALPDVMASQIRSNVNSWIASLDDYAKCQPVNFQITELGDLVRVDGGATSGLKMGDRLLVLDQTRIPDRVLEPGALAELSLAQVVRVEEDSAVLEYAAGAPLTGAAGKVALLF